MLRLRPITDPASGDVSDSRETDTVYSPVLLPPHARHEVDDLERGQAITKVIWLLFGGHCGSVLTTLET
jgi:hypothetical protein